MKTHKFTKSFRSASIALLAIFSSATALNAQSWQRVYANGESNNHGEGIAIVGVASVSDSNNAIGSNLSDYSTLSFSLAGEARQRFTFSETPGTNPIHIKVGKGATVLDLLPTITVTAYDASNNPVGSQSVGALLGALKGVSQMDIVVTPTSSATSVEVSYSGVSLGTGVRVYAAYFDKPSTTDTLYNKPLDILSSSNGALGGGVLSAVTNSNNAIDGYDTTFASINKLADVLNSNHLTALFSSKSALGDTVRLVLNNPGSLLTAGLLSSGLSVSTFNGSTETNIFSDASLLDLRLLAGATDKYILSIPTSVQFDKIRVGTSGTLSTTYGLNVYEIGRKIPTVGFTQDTVIYDGGTIPTLTAELPNLTDSVVWYSTNTPTGTPLATGLSYTPSAIPTVSVNYYAFVKRNGTIQAASVGAVYLQVKTVFVKPIVLLEGAYRSDSTKMTTRLSTLGYLPTTFGSTTQSDINTLTVNGQRVVDWVTLELRDTTASHTLLESRVGLLLSNGRVVPPTSLDSFLFKQIAGTYHLVITHRNHLPVVAKVSLNATPVVIDFTSESVITSSQMFIDSRKMMHLGNVSNNSAISSTDFSTIRPIALESPFAGYYTGDVDFNGSVTSTDVSKLRVKTLLAPFMAYTGL